MSPELPASQTMPNEVVQVVASLAKVPASSLSTLQCWQTIAGQGGYLGRRGDGPFQVEVFWHTQAAVRARARALRFCSRLRSR